ncbi:MAG: RibD family protein, partial [Planctomycetes bacterium]|nr:RibD family protein [Planctomycetota bacterium]
GFISLQTRKRPYITAKWAMTLDGKIATRRGDSKWISSDTSRELVHEERAANDAVMVGIGTVLADDPTLTARGVEGKQPTRVILDPKLALSTQSNLMKTINEAPVLIYTAKDRGEQSKRLKDAGAEIVEVDSDGREHLSWAEVLYNMGSRGLASMLLEGGGGIVASAFEFKAIDRVMIFVAPVIIGGKNAVTPVGGVGVPEIAKGVKLKDMSSRMVGPDVYIEGVCVYPEGARKASESGIWRGFRDLDLRADNKRS